VRLWRGIESLPNSKVLYGEIMRAARLGMNLVGTSVAVERAFPCMKFIKKQLADTSVDKFSPLHAMKLQAWFDLVTFPSCVISIPHVDLGRSVLLA
jgi:hypothetical protein